MTRRPLALAAAALLAACSSGGSSFAENGRIAATGSGADQVATLDMTDDLAFRPNVVTAEVGTLALTADNTGRVPHDLVFDEKGLGGTDTVRGGKQATLRVTFTQAGTFTFSCTLHSGMDGKVVVASAGQG